jgi:phage N-6-adenine-methyltransferase
MAGRMSSDSWNNHLTSSGKVEYGTPLPLYRQLDKLLGPFDLDCCSTPVLAKVPGNFISPEEDALTVNWAERGRKIWCNFPYGNAANNLAWIRKSIEASEQGSMVAVLCFVRSDTQWFKEALNHASQLILITGRVKFSGSKYNAPFPSCVIVFRPGQRGGVRVSLLRQES